MTGKIEDVLSKIDSGPYMWIIFLLCSMWGLFGAMLAMSAAFLVAETDHWCQVETLESTNWTLEQRKNISLPWDTKESDFSSCLMYNRSYSSMSDASFEEAYDFYAMDPNSSTVKCSSWEYDTSVMSSTVISEWDLVCDREYLKSFTQSVFMAGVFVGSPVNGILSDKFGRKRILSLGMFMFLVAAVASVIVNWYPAYLVCRFVIALGGHFVYQTSYIIAIESSSIRHRGTVGILFSVPFAIGNIVLPGIAYLVRDWRYLHLAISLPAALLIFNLIILPESPRWLIQVNRKEDAIKEFQRAARWNRKEPFDEQWLANIVDEIHSTCVSDIQNTTGDGKLENGSLEKVQKEQNINMVQSLKILLGNLFMVKITVILSIVWLTCTLVYYGISLNANNLSTNPFLYMMIGGFVEIPSYVFGAPIVKIIGRKKTMIATLFITGVAVLGPLAVNDANRSSWWFLTVMMLGKMAITMAFQVLYLFTSELYPTFLRTQGLGLTSMIGRIGAIISPFVIHIGGSKHWYIPSIIFGICSVISGVLTCFLPETASRELPDSVQDMKNWSNVNRSKKEGTNYANKIDEGATQQLMPQNNGVNGCKIIPDGYQKDLRPNYGGEAEKIGFSMKINSITNVDMNAMSITFQMNLRMVWKDSRLLYPGQMSNQSTDGEEELPSKEREKMAVSNEILNQVWTPDPFFRHTRDLTMFQLLQDFRGVFLHSDRTIYTSMVIRLELGCSMAFTNFPFDEQQCELYIGSYFYPITDMEFEWLETGVTLDNAVKELLAGYDFSVTKINDTKCLCKKCVPEWSPCLRTQLILSRKYLVHMLGYYIPSGLFVGVSWCSFFWPAEVIPGRTVLVITSLLTVSSMYGASRQTGPTTSYVKAIDTWMFMTIVLAMVALFQYALVLQWRKRADSLRVNKINPTGKNMMDSNKDEVAKYRRYEEKTEQLGRYGVPLMFFLFNLCYWPYYVT